MATLSWTNLNPTVKIVDTKKKFFGQYLYKTVFKVPGCRLITSRESESMSHLLDYQKQLANLVAYRYNGAWSYQRNPTTRLSDARVAQLEYFKSILQTHKDQIKVRVEQPILTLYSQDEQVLMEIARTEADSLLEVHRPGNLQAAEALDRGECIVKTITEYTHKVVFKESGSLSIETRANIYDYLINLGDVVKMTKSCRENLSGNRYWFTSSYFYTKDESILTFLNLIAPGAVAGIYKLAVM
jgi:hypothetical protein